MAFTLDPQTGKIIFGVVADLTHDAIAIDLASQFGVSEAFKDNFTVNDPTVEDNFTSDNFTNINGARVAVNTGTQVMDWVSSGATLYNDGEFRDVLGQTIDASNWTIRFKLTVSSSSIGADGTANSLFVGFSDDNTSLAGTVQDFAGFQIFRQATGNTGAFRLMTTDGTAPNISAGTDTTLIPTVDTYFVEFIRNGSTITGNIYSDASFNVLTESVSQAIGAGVTGLRHLKVMVSNRDGTGDHTFAGTIDDVQFFNGEATLTNWSEDGSGDFTVSGGVMNWETDDTILNHFSFVDMLGTTISDTEWVLRYKLTIDAFAQGSDTTNQELYIVLGDTTNTATESNQDAIGLRLVVDNSLSEIRMINADGNNLQNSSGTLLATNISATTFFVEIKRTSATGSTISLFSDENYSTLIESEDVVIPSTITDLRYMRIQNRDGLDGTNDHTLDGIIDDVQFWNGITVPVITSNNWRLRFTLDITDLDLVSGSDLSMWIGLSDKDETSKSNQVNDSFLLATFVDSGVKSFSFGTADNQQPRASGSDVVMTTVPIVDTFFVEMQRNSDSETTVSFYTDSTFTSTLETNTQTGISGTDNLKYLKIFNDEPGNNANTMDGTLDDITFTQLVSLSVEIDKTFLIDALLQELDQEETFLVDALLQALDQEETFLVDALIKSLGDNSSCISTYTDDYSTDRFVDNDATFISVGTGRMNFDAQTDNTNDASASDISLAGRFGSILPSTWRIRFEINFTSFGTGNNNHMMFSIGDEDQLTNSETGFGSDEMSIGFHALTGVAPDSNKRMTGYHKDGDTQINTASIIDGGSVTMTGTKFYQIERTSDTSVTYSIFSDAGFTTLINSVVQTIPNLTGMQYFKVSNFKFDNSGEGAIIGRVDNLEILGLNPIGTVACPQVDTLLQAEQTETFEVDAIILVKTIDETFDVDALLDLTVDEEFFVDALLQELGQEFNFTIDGLLFITPSRLTCVDALVRDTFDEDFAVDAIVATIIEGNHLTWQFREHRAFGLFFANLINLIEIPSPFRNEMRSSVSSRARGYVFKNFRKSEVTGSDLTVRLQRTQGSNETFIEVLDGAYNNQSTTDFVNSGGRAVKGAGILGSDFVKLADGDTTLTLPASSIDYASSTEEFICVFVHHNDNGTGSGGSTFTSTILFGGGLWTFDAGQVLSAVIDVVQPEAGGRTRFINAGSVVPADQFSLDAFIKRLGENGSCNVSGTTVSDDFSSDNFTHVGTNSVSGGVLNWEGARNGTSNISNRPITAPSNSTMLYRTKLTISNLSSPSSGVHRLMVGLARADESTSGTGLDDFMGFRIEADSGGTDVFRFIATNNQNPSISGIEYTFTTVPSVGTFFLEFQRFTTTTAKATIYSDANYTVPIETSGIQTVTQGGGITGLANAKIMNDDGTALTGGALDGTQDDLDVWSGVISPQSGSVACMEADARVVDRFDKEFTLNGLIQAKPQIPFEFEIDAIIRYAQGSAVDQFGAIPDLIIRVLRENGTLTGRGIVDEIVIITTAENFPFRGKNSRIKNWLNRLRLDGLTQEDGSSPDWYKTIWSLV